MTKSLRENVAALQTAKAAVTSHCMCVRLREKPGVLIVDFPPGYAVDGAQVRYGALGFSKARGFELLLATCEKYWMLGAPSAFAQAARK